VVNAASTIASDPERRLTLRHADQAREDFAALLDELDFVKSQLSQMATAPEGGVSSSASLLKALSPASCAGLVCDLPV
jgi:hypothetical protein